ncbi:HAD-IA family hydrolase [Alisedimentitalea sp. MJ-SS2]|uniref:HAD-IA family hydrolase n=1 Tax=Aliisedimentitalea sp. MJ-SS2 TaxID=3049795 RepID=UPI00290B3250|nr:HAD-IA family hydrolase [Alisedimentitalea sp. MJ-SS2]MDU8928608.1 HAD-IA family hydrolase [Alisedimentitalea sp. MJ-SS2]
MSDLGLAIFDVDGTLADSQAEIVLAMTAAFTSENLAVPDRAAILSIVGLSLDHAMPVLAPKATGATRARLVAGYKQAYFDHRAANGASPLYDGALAVLERLSEDPFLLMGVATGKSKRGLDALIDAHDLHRFFVTRQVADFHPSKPHPGMIRAALAQAGVEAQNAVMIGDTSYDIDMARAAGTRAIGVGWGYHETHRLKADLIVCDMPALPDAVLQTLSPENATQPQSKGRIVHE